MTSPRATYRVQLGSGFGFGETAKLAPYLARLGVSHVYLSPIFKARPKSPHGYDITDHATLNPDLGGESEFSAMIEALRREGLGAILDFVPNHMGVGGADNPHWLDVLEWGPESRYAGWFDIDWDAGGGKVLAPVLGAQYGDELERGNLVLRSEDDGTFAVWAYGVHKLPVCPLTYPMVLGHDDEALDRMSDRFLDLPPWRPQIVERALALKTELAALAGADESARRAIDQRVAAFNRDWREMDRLIAAQFWRAAFFRVAEDEINYRRFFNINDLAGLRMELTPVFEHAHERTLRMIEDREIDGLRIDHVDGLFDPKSYLTALRERVDRPLYLVIEKILAQHERLRADWPVEGTTGYDYLNLSLGLLVCPSSETAFSQTYRAFAETDQTFEEIALASKLRIMDNEMAAELGALGRAAARLARQSPMTADLTRGILTRAIKAIVACFPVYRTYVDLGGAVDEADRRDLSWAVARARRLDPDVHPSAFDVLGSLLVGDPGASSADGIGRTAALRFAMKLQQFSGPVMAKGVEDTAFYRYNRFIALNEVGGAPQRFGIEPSLFHKANAQRQERWPHAMLSTATHDTKRGEDGRARLAVLSEVPEEWRRQVSSWSRLIRARLGDVEGKAPPVPDDEYMFYQMLVGSWPLELIAAPSAEGLETFRVRIGAALEKALREGKQRSNWAAPDLEYEAAMRAFVREALRPDSGFLAAFLPFVGRIARLGIQNSLVQTALKLLVPGVPDIYQGCELWDLSLVDPDNRRPVDYRERETALARLAPRLDRRGGRTELLESLLATAHDGRIKLALTALLLGFRRDQPELFAKGGYAPIEFTGEDADWALGFVRAAGESRVAVLAARFPALREEKPGWRAQAQMPEGDWFDCLRARRFNARSPLAAWFKGLPLAVLTSTQPAAKA